MTDNEIVPGEEWHFETILRVQKSAGVLIVGFFLVIISIFLYSIAFDLVPFFASEDSFPVWVIVTISSQVFQVIRVFRLGSPDS